MTSDKIHDELKNITDGVSITQLGSYAFNYRVAMWALTILIARTLIEILTHIEDLKNYRTDDNGHS